MAHNSWNDACDVLVEAMKTKQEPEEPIEPLVAKLDDVNASHIYREAEFTLLFHASLENSEPAVKALLEFGADPTFKNSNGTTVLSLMVKRGQHSMIKRCIAKINDTARVRDWIYVASKSGWTPLMAAANGRDQRVVQLLLDHGADPNQQMSTGWTAMHTAAKAANGAAFQALIKAGGDPTLLAIHRDFGENLTCSNVTTDEAILKLYSDYIDTQK